MADATVAAHSTEAAPPTRCPCERHEEEEIELIAHLPRRCTSCCDRQRTDGRTDGRIAIAAAAGEPETAVKTGRGHFGNEHTLNPLTRIHWRAGLVPAAAVIPAAPIAYIKVAAVKKLVVGYRDRARSLPRGDLCSSRPTFRFSLYSSR